MRFNLTFFLSFSQLPAIRSRLGFNKMLWTLPCIVPHFDISGELGDMEKSNTGKLDGMSFRLFHGKRLRSCTCNGQTIYIATILQPTFLLDALGNNPDGDPETQTAQAFPEYVLQRNERGSRRSSWTRWRMKALQVKLTVVPPVFLESGSRPPAFPTEGKNNLRPPLGTK